MKFEPTGLTLLLGGARSGKSDLAVKMADEAFMPVTFVATAQAFDQDMASRIARHKNERPTNWDLVEAPTFGGPELDLVPADRLVLVDCITLLVSNLMLSDHDEAAILGHAQTLAEAAGERLAPTIVISNEVGMGIVPATEMGREYRDILGRVNRMLVSFSADAFLVVAGAGLPLQAF